MKGYIHSVETFGAVDGPGIRYVVFMQGCPIRCQYCHNPDTWNIKAGTEISVSRLVKDIKPYLNYIKLGGVTVSGGEPLLQAKFVYKLIKSLHKLGINVAIDTAASLPLEKTQKTIDASDMLLLDIKAIDNELNKIVCGAPNKNMLETLNYCEKVNKPVWIRHVVVPGLTFDEKQLEDLAKFLTNYKCVKNIELMGFHKMGEFKWKELGYDYKLLDTPEASKEQMKIARKIFEKYNLPIKK